jgi:hypothetical protein
MKYLERFFRWMFWVVVTAVVAWIFKKAFQHAAGQNSNTVHGRVAPSAPITKTKELFRDPVCGTYVAEDVAFSLVQGGENLHFCSRDCMLKAVASDKWRVTSSGENIARMKRAIGR